MVKTFLIFLVCYIIAHPVAAFGHIESVKITAVNYKIESPNRINSPKGKRNKKKAGTRKKIRIKVSGKKYIKKVTKSRRSFKKKMGISIPLDDFSRNKGTFYSPLEEGIIKTGFGPYRVGNSEIVGYNPGLTLEAVQGSCVQSVFEGVVTDLFQVDGHWGVTIQHGNYFTVYSNLVSVKVCEKDKIASGAAIGKAASNDEGYAELEFLILKRNSNIDPAPWIRKSCVKASTL